MNGVRRMGMSVVVGLLMVGRVMAGSLDPTNAPGPTMHTMEEIYQKVQHLRPMQTLSDTTTSVEAGYYSATNLTAVDADLAAGNIKSNVTIFGVTGTLSTNYSGSVYPALVPKTGQTTSYQTGDDGDYAKGVAWPNPRFTVQADTNCVLDNLTGLIWARNASLGGTMTWSDAIVYCENLNYGGQTDWRLPNLRELQSLVDYSQSRPPLCNTAGTGKWSENDPFTGVQQVHYWTSSTLASDTSGAWDVELFNGAVNAVGRKTYTYCPVWPVRGGQ